MGMSAPISEALIVYAELTQFRPSQHLQPTVIAVITGVPILAVFATELTHQSTGWRHETWWLICGSGVYNIFISCATMIFLVFILLYMGVLHKVHALVEENVMKREAIETRIRILHRAAIVICTEAMAANQNFTLTQAVFKEAITKALRSSKQRFRNRQVENNDGNSRDGSDEIDALSSEDES